jgi:hypothetical protein
VQAPSFTREAAGALPEITLINSPTAATPKTVSPTASVGAAPTLGAPQRMPVPGMNGATKVCRFLLDRAVENINGHALAMVRTLQQIE